MEAQFLPSRYALIGRYLGVGNVKQGDDIVADAIARIRQRDMVFTFQAGMDPVFLFLQKAPSIPEYDEWYAQTDGPWGEEDLAGMLAGMGYLVTISPSTFLGREHTSMLTLKFQETPEFDLPPSHIEGVESLSFWYDLTQQRSFADMRNSLLLNHNKSMSEADEFIAREVSALLHSRYAYLDWADKRERQEAAGPASITL